MRAYLQTLLVTGFGNPLLYLFGLGVGLATLVKTGGCRSAAPPTRSSSRPRSCAQRGRHGRGDEEFSYPVLMGFKWNPIFFGMNAGPDLRAADRRTA